MLKFCGRHISTASLSLSLSLSLSRDPRTPDESSLLSPLNMSTTLALLEY